MAGLSVDNVLALRQSILQRNSALQDAAAAGSTPSGPAAPAGGANQDNFTSALRNALSEVNALQADSAAQAEAFERGETTDIAAVMLAKQQASIGFETTLQVRNKLLSAYKDIMSMPV
ncbi:MAG TPA: flagellar hook-basal body complex protein FliE [Sphingobium sp.]|nr:flagellar hook-basal body complex protein FliE [Sphingobium sp.]